MPQNSTKSRIRNLHSIEIKKGIIYSTKRDALFQTTAVTYASIY